MSLRIRKLKLTEIRQFRDVTFDFTDPKTGKALDRVCLIGGNGTGKSTLLRLLASQRLLKIDQFQNFPINYPSKWTVGFEEDIERACFNQDGSLGVWHSDFEEVIEAGFKKPIDFNFDTLSEHNIWSKRLNDSIAVYCPPDSELSPNSGAINDVPTSSLDLALSFLKSPDKKFKVGQDTVDDFWKLLIALIKDREARLLEYNRRPENMERTIREVEEEFLANNPDMLKELTELWEPILTKAGLKFDYEQASVPVQLTDNLKAYIRLLAENAVIPYADLSTGIRSFLFRLGHLFTIFRFHSQKGGIILVDEPENSLYPDFLFDLLSHYEKAAPGAQMFFATHSPIVAAQFRPEERFILEFDPDHGVVVRRGVTPEGDDPNDVLLKDFAVRTLYGTKGVESWKRFRELNQSIETETNPMTRKEMLKEYLELGRAYNFDPHNELSA
jgi:energy-coupling factor transporter ATP-binding protein EcfA2